MRAAASSDGTITRARPASSAAERLRSAATVMSSSIRLPASATHASHCATVGLAAVALRRADQCDAAAQPGVVMHMQVVRHAETGKQLAARPGGGRPDGAARWRPDARAASRRRSCRQLARHREAQIGISFAVPSPTVTHRVPSGARGGTQHDGAVPAGAMPFDRCRDLAFDAAALGVGDQDHRLAAAAPRSTPARQIQPPPRRRQRVRHGVRLDQRGHSRDAAAPAAPRCAPADAVRRAPNEWPPTCATNTPGAATCRQPRWRARRQKSFSSP